MPARRVQRPDVVGDGPGPWTGRNSSVGREQPIGLAAGACRTPPRRSFEKLALVEFHRPLDVAADSAHRTCSSFTRTPPAGGSRSTSQSRPRQDPSSRRSLAWCKRHRAAPNEAVDGRDVPVERGANDVADLLVFLRKRLAEPVIAEPGSQMTDLSTACNEGGDIGCRRRSTEETPGKHIRPKRLVGHPWHGAWLSNVRTSAGCAPPCASTSSAPPSAARAADRRPRCRSPGLPGISFTSTLASRSGYVPWSPGRPSHWR